MRFNCHVCLLFHSWETPSLLPWGFDSRAATQRLLLKNTAKGQSMISTSLLRERHYRIVGAGRGAGLIHDIHVFRLASVTGGSPRTSQIRKQDRIRVATKEWSL